jgi:tetratricopeptide (TPR) repeat protein
MALFGEGKLEECREEFEKALRQDMNYREAHYELAMVLERQHLTGEAIAHYRAAIRISPDYPEALNNLAWVLASDPRAEIRNGAEAVRLATRACELTHDKAPLLLGTLAAAYAEAGRFDEAVATAQKAHDVAATAGRTQIAARNLELLGVYRSHHPYHEGETR